MFLKQNCALNQTLRIEKIEFILKKKIDGGIEKIKSSHKKHKRKDNLLKVFHIRMLLIQSIFKQQLNTTSSKGLAMIDYEKFEDDNRVDKIV